MRGINHPRYDTYCMVAPILYGRLYFDLQKIGNAPFQIVIIILHVLTTALLLCPPLYDKWFFRLKLIILLYKLLYKQNKTEKNDVYKNTKNISY